MNISEVLQGNINFLHFKLTPEYFLEAFYIMPFYVYKHFYNTVSI